MPRKMVRTSGPFSTWALGLESTREISWIGTGSMTSTSPESKAATRVASEPIGVKIISFRLCSGLRHQLGLALSDAKLGEVAATGVGAALLFASAHFLSMMYQVSHWEFRMGFGEVRRKS